MPSFRTILQVAAVTMASMYVMNLAAAKIPQARGLIKGNALVAI